MKHYLFAKFLNHMSLEELMDKCVELGIDGPTALIRDGYWLSQENIITELGGYVKAAESRGLEVKYADTDISMEHIDCQLDQIKALRDNGIEQFRLAYIVRKQFDGHVRELHEYTARLMAHAAEVAEKIGIQAIVQIHGYMYPLNATGAWHCVKGLNPKHIGIKLDLGNNFRMEGFEEYDYQIPLLGEYIAALGEKDARLVKGEDQGDGEKGWVREFVPAYEGCTNYKKVFNELRNIGFQGPAILMPFYHEDNYPALEKELIKETAYFKKLEREVGL